MTTHITQPDVSHSSDATPGKGSTLTRLFAQTIAANTLTLGAGAIGSVLAARILAPAGRGELAAIMTWCSMTTMLGEIGVSQACIYYAGKRPGLAGAVLATTLALGVGGSVIVSAGVVLACFWFSQRNLSFFVYLTSIPFTLSATYTAAVLLGLNRITYFNAVRVCSALAYPVGLLAAFAFGARRLNEALPLIIGCQICAAVIAFGVTMRVLPVRGWHIERTLGKELLAYGIRSYAGVLFWLTNGRLDQAILPLFAPMRDLGMYAVACSYANILFGVAGALANVIFPRIVNASSSAQNREVINALRYVGLISIIPAVGMAAVGGRVIPAVFGAAYASAVYPAAILLAGSCLLSVNYVLNNALRASGRPGAPTIAEGAGLAVTLSGLPVAIPRWGISGAAWVSVGSYALTTIILLWLWRTRTQVSTTVPSDR